MVLDRPPQSYIARSDAYVKKKYGLRVSKGYEKHDLTEFRLSFWVRGEIRIHFSDRIILFRLKTKLTYKLINEVNSTLISLIIK